MTRLLTLYPKTTNLVLVLLFAIIVIVYSSHLNIEKNNILYTDFGKFYQSAKMSLTGHNPYARVMVIENNHHTDKAPSQPVRFAGNLNTPFFQLITLPLGNVSYTTALYLWTALSLIGAALSIAILFNILQIKLSSFKLYFAFLFSLLIYFQSFASFIFGQVTFILLPLLLGAWYCARKQTKLHECLLGILLAIAVNIKIFCALFIIYLVFQKSWRALTWFTVMMAVCLLIPVILYGTQIYPRYLFILNHIWWYTSNFNASLYGFLGRLFGLNEKNTPLVPIPGLAKSLYWVLSSFLIIYLIKILRTNTVIDKIKKIDLNFSVIIVAMLLLSPLGWSYYFPILIIPFCVLFKLASENYNPFVLISLTCLAIILSSYPCLVNDPAWVSGGVKIFISSGCYFYALILLLGLLFYTRRLCALPPNQNPILTNSLMVGFYIIILTPSVLGMITSTENLASKTKSWSAITIEQIKD